MSFLKQLAGETTIYGFGHVLPRLLNYVFLTPVLTRLLTQDDFGIHRAYYMLAGFMIILFTYRLETAFFRYGSQSEERDKYFSTAILFILFFTPLIGLVLYVCRVDIAYFVTKDVQHSRFVTYCIIMIGLDALAAIPFAKLRLEQKALLYTWLKLINVILIIGLALVFLLLIPYLKTENVITSNHFFTDSTKFVDFIFISNIIASGIVLIILLFQLRIISWRFDQTAAKKMILYSIPLIPVGIAGIINMSGDQWFIIHFLSADENNNLAESGVYAAAKQIAIIMSLFVIAYNYAFEPFIFRNAKEENAKWMYAKTAQAFTLLSCLLMLIVILFIDIIQLILGADFRQGIFIVPIAIFAFFFLGLYYNFSIWYKLTDKTHFGAIIAIIGAIITIGLNLALLPRIGYIGSSIASLLCFMTMSVLCLIWGRRYYPIDYPLGKMGMYIIMTIIALGISYGGGAYFNLSGGLIWAFRLSLLIIFLGYIYFSEKEDLLSILKDR